MELGGGRGEAPGGVDVVEPAVLRPHTNTDSLELQVRRLFPHGLLGPSYIRKGIVFVPVVIHHLTNIPTGSDAGSEGSNKTHQVFDVVTKQRLIPCSQQVLVIKGALICSVPQNVAAAVV